ncbi:V-type ATP synthase subunit C [Lachnoclostridium sp. An131]|uniref:V0D/AC39 family V-type ATPase subunit n=1 Tax=Lachnoclostridium sp. An131 TaxID=1965555 RepID=UPI000B37A19D|nr:V-type ATPase subunit [Lachnoclostridium sp. An131]OUQ22882.1 V-type ATP synthase subunit C [Lachnoclostridium sp. An131]
MSDVDYVYAVARIRSKELGLFSAAVIEQLLSRPDYEACVSFLAEKGWGGADTPRDGEAILMREREKTWEDIRDLTPDMSVFELLNYTNVFHNLKAAVKEVCTGAKVDHIYYSDTDPSAEEILEAVQEKDFDSLPEYMAGAAKEAFETLLHTKDGQLCDVIVDRAALDAVCRAGQSSKTPVLRDYAEATVSAADIRIAARCCRTGKPEGFILRALAPCATLSAEELAHAAAAGEQELRAYLKSTAYGGAADALDVSLSEFERWCDNQVIEAMKPQKYNPFSVGPLVAYALARENEIKTVRIILSGKRTGMPEASIRERVREMYV